MSISLAFPFASPRADLPQFSSFSVRYRMSIVKADGVAHIVDPHAHPNVYRREYRTAKISETSYQQVRGILAEPSYSVEDFRKEKETEKRETQEAHNLEIKELAERQTKHLTKKGRRKTTLEAARAKVLAAKGRVAKT